MMEKWLLVLTCFIISATPAYARASQFHFFYDKNLSKDAVECVKDAAKILSAKVQEADVNTVLQKISPKPDKVVVRIYKENKNVAPEAFSIHSEANGKNITYSITAGSNTGIMYGVYRFAENAGVRFFHPEQTFVPVKFMTPVINIDYKPSYKVRGYQPHTMHTIEMMYALYYPQNFKYAKNYMDWLVRNGQNYIVFPLLEEIEPRWNEWAPYIRKLVDYAHNRGIKIGPSLQMFPGLQKNAYFFLTDDVNWKEKVDAKLKMYFTVPWDFLEGELGEFVQADATQTVEWFDYIATQLKTKYKVDFDIKVHVGGKLRAKYKGQDVLYYFLPEFSIPDVGIMVHTVMFYDLFRPAPAYDHENFFEHREYLIEQLGKRRVIYFPESAYWCSFDIDVPVWFAEYIYARWNDMTKLSDYALDGHVTFTSGFEWMHFLTDYLVAKQTWDNKIPLEMLVTWYSEIFGSAAEEVQEILLELMKLQNDFLIEKNLTAFLSGEDHYDELGWFGNIKTHPPFLRFNRVAKKKMSKVTGEKFVNDLQAAKDFVKKYDEFLATLDSIKKEIPLPARPWHDELVDSIEITKLRVEHVIKLYEGAFELRFDNTKAAQDALSAAKKIRLRAETVIRLREKSYRYPPHMMYERNSNYTMYPFAYLHQAHTLCFWTRREEELAQNIVGKFNAFALPKCL